VLEAYDIRFQVSCDVVYSGSIGVQAFRVYQLAACSWFSISIQWMLLWLLIYESSFPCSFWNLGFSGPKQRGFENEAQLINLFQPDHTY